MKFLKYAFPLLILLFTLAVAACAQQPTVPTPAASGGTSTATSGSTAPSNTPTAAVQATALIKTATATVKGASTTILTNAQGLTLYYRTSDKPPSTVCSGGCAGAWPPLLFTGSGAPTSSTQLPGKLTVVVDANGNQVEYNGHPLYNFASDTGPGQTNGEGIGGIWFVCTPDLH
jgi:predicted lipoprotein with Yx(FWY)xxD motif